MFRFFEGKIRSPTLFEVSRVTTGCCWKHILFWGKSYRLSLVGCGCVGHRLGVGRDGWGVWGGDRSSLERGQFVRGTGKTFSVTRLSYRIIRWQGTVPWCWKGILHIFFYLIHLILPWWSFSSFNSRSFMEACLFSLKSKLSPKQQFTFSKFVNQLFQSYAFATRRQIHVTDWLRWLLTWHVHSQRISMTLPCAEMFTGWSLDGDW